MFVYLFCIVWATFFVFLAECQFKKVSIKRKRDDSKSESVLKKKKTKDSSKGEDIAQDKKPEISNAEQANMKPVEKTKHFTKMDNKIDIMAPKDKTSKDKKTKDTYGDVILLQEGLSHEGSALRGRKIIEVVQYGNDVNKAKSRTVGNEIFKKNVKGKNDSTDKNVADVKKPKDHKQKTTDRKDKHE